MCQEGAAGVVVGAGAATSPAVTLVCSPWGVCRTALHPVCCGVSTGCCPLHGALHSTSSVSSSCGGHVCPPMASYSSARVSHCTQPHLMLFVFWRPSVLLLCCLHAPSSFAWPTQMLADISSVGCMLFMTAGERVLRRNLLLLDSKNACVRSVASRYSMWIK